MSQKWREVRVFISSTFRDMDAERDHLVKRVFPQLRERLLPYRIHLIDIDLRWGITPEEAEDDRVLDLCLAQIDDCRPFFVGILGHRYGWVPNRIILPRRRVYSRIRSMRHKSVTELEILYGVLRNPRMKGHALFFFRDETALNTVPADKLDTFRDTGKPADDLRKLKSEIQQNSYPVTLYSAHWDNNCQRLAGLDAFGDAVLEQLWQGIKAEHDLSDIPPKFNDDPLHQERDFHGRFIESRTRVYVGRESSQRALIRYTHSASTVPCIVTGPSGSGKSATLAQFVAQYGERHPRVFVLPHFVGASPRSTSLPDMLRRLCEELRNAFNITETVEREDQPPQIVPAEIPLETTALADRFGEFLKKAATTAPPLHESVPRQDGTDPVPHARQGVHRLISAAIGFLKKIGLGLVQRRPPKILLIIDALDQLDDTGNAHSLFWLPRELPPNVKIVLSCITQEPVTARDRRTIGRDVTLSHTSDYAAACKPVFTVFAHRPHERLDIQPLTQEERRDIASRVPSISAKKLAPAQMQLLLTNPATENPLYLLVALEELRGFGSFETLNQRIAALPQGEDPVTALFLQVLERLEHDFEPTTVRSLLSLLASSRHGLSEKELEELAVPQTAISCDNTPSNESDGCCSVSDLDNSDLFPILRQIRPYLQHRGELLDFFHRNLYKAVRVHCLNTEQAQRAAHAKLAIYFAAKPLHTPQDGIEKPNVHKLQEQAYQQALAGLDDACRTTLTDLRFLEAKCSVGMACDCLADYDRLGVETLQSRPPIVTARRQDSHHGFQCPMCLAWSPVAEADLGGSVQCPYCSLEVLLNSFALASAWSPSDPQRQARPHTSKKTPTAQSEAANDFAKLVRRYVQVLNTHPGVLFQAAMNSPSGSATANTAEQAWLEGREKRPWLRLLNKLQSPWAAVMFLSGRPPCTFSPDGQHLVTASEDGRRLLIRDLQTGSMHAILQGQRMNACCAYSPDGRFIAAGNVSGMISVWDAESGALLNQFHGHTKAVSGCCWSPTEGRFASCSQDKTVNVWDGVAGAILLNIEGSSPFQCCAYSPDGRTLIAGERDGTLGVWDTGNGRRLLRIETGDHTPTCCAWAPDGHVIAVTFSDGELAVFHSLDGAKRGGNKISKGRHNVAYSCAFSPEGRRIAVASHEKTLYVCDAETLETLARFTGHGSQVLDCAFSPDGCYAASVSADGIVVVWDTSNPMAREPETYLSRRVEACVFDAAGARAIFAYDDGLQTLKIDSREQILDFHYLGDYGEVVTGLAVSPDGKHLAATTTYGRLILLDSDTLTELRSFNPPWRSGFHSIQLQDCCFSPDGRYVIAAGGDREKETGALLCVAEVEGKEYAYVHHDQEGKLLTCCACSPDSQLVVCGSFDHTLRLYSLRHGLEFEFRGHTGIVTDCDFSPDGRRIVSSSSDGTLRVWDAVLGEQIPTSLGHPGGAVACAYSADGRWILSAGADRLVTLWNVRTGQRMSSYVGHGLFSTAAFSRDSRLIAAGEEWGFTHVLRLEEPAVEPLSTRPKDGRKRILYVEQKLFAVASFAHDYHVSVVNGLRAHYDVETAYDLDDHIVEMVHNALGNTPYDAIVTDVPFDSKTSSYGPSRAVLEKLRKMAAVPIVACTNAAGLNGAMIGGHVDCLVDKPSNPDNAVKTIIAGLDSAWRSWERRGAIAPPVIEKIDGQTLIKTTLNLAGGLATVGAMALIEECRPYTRSVKLKRPDGQKDEASCASMMQLLSFCAAEGSPVQIVVDGTDAEAEYLARRIYGGITSDYECDMHFDRFAPVRNHGPE